MRSDDVKLETLYYSTFDDNSFAAVFYVMAKRHSRMSAIIRYYPDERWQHTYLDRDSFDWDEYDDDLPDQTWLTDSQEFNPRYDKGIKREYCLSFISWLFNGIGE